jgi:hypothetical protein
MRQSRSERCQRLARAVLVAALCACGPTACVKDAAPVPPAVRTDIAVWDFPPELGAGLALFPPEARAPQRRKHHLSTRDEESRLVTVVEGIDPYLVWSFELPVAAFSVHLELDALADGQVQVFWNTPRCPVFSESCSAVSPIARGRQTVEVLLDPRDSLRELRVDLPDHTGATVVWNRIVVMRTASLAGVWAPNGAARDTTLTPTGLAVQASGPDPWLAVGTPGFVAERATAVELVLRGTGAAPQLFWAGPSGALSEASSVHLPAFDSGALTHRAILRGRPGWSGAVRSLRLDPGADAGNYVIERFALVYDPADEAPRAAK